MGAGLAFGWYPNAEIEDITGFGYNLGASASIKEANINFGAELNFTTDLSAEGLADFWDKMRIGGNGTPPGTSSGIGGAAYFELGYIFSGKALDFKEATIGDIMNAFQGIGLEINYMETFEMIIMLLDIWNNRVDGYN